MLIDTGGKVIVIGSDLVETFNDHYINIVEKFGRQTLQICFWHKFIGRWRGHEQNSATLIAITLAYLN